MSSWTLVGLLSLSHNGNSTILLSISVDLPILDISYKWNRTVCGLCDWLHSFSKIIFIAQPCYSMYQYFIPSYCWIMYNWIARPCFIYLFIRWCFPPPLAFRKSGAMNIHIQVFVETYPAISLVSIHRSGIAGSCCNPVFDLWRNCQTVFHRGCTISHFCLQSMRVPILSHPHQCSLFSFFKLFFATSMACISSWARVWTCTAVVTHATAAAMLDP